MEIWFHLTDDPDFRLDPNRVPHNLNAIQLGAGVFLTRRPDEWAFSQSVGATGHWSGERPYVVEIDAPPAAHRLPGAWFDPDATRPGEPPGCDELFLPANQFHRLTVLTVRRRDG